MAELEEYEQEFAMNPRFGEGSRKKKDYHRYFLCYDYHRYFLNYLLHHAFRVSLQK